MNRRAFVASAVTLSVLPAASDVIWAQINSRPIRMLVPLAPGGAVDSYARLIADHMARTLGRVIIVDHRAGGTGPAFAADIRAQAGRWARLVKASGFKAEGD